jgi:hypothetical protein
MRARRSDDPASNDQAWLEGKDRPAAHPPPRDRLADVVDDRGGEYCFIPNLSALRRLSELET